MAGAKIPPQSKFTQAYKLATQGRDEAACALLLKLAAEFPSHGDTLAMLVAVLCRLGRAQQALYYADRAVAADPSSRVAVSNRANVYMMLDRPEEGRRDMRAALAMEPENLELRCVLANACLMANKHDEALATLEAVKDRLGQHDRAAAAYAGVLQTVGRADEAFRLHGEVLLRRPDDPAAAERVLTSAIYATAPSKARIKEAAARYGRLVSQRMPVSRAAHANDPDPERRIRIGFIGPDFREHASMRFFEPLASSYDRARLDVRCYATYQKSSATTERIRAAVDGFVMVEGQAASDLAARIRRDGIDVLVDMAGHTTGHRIDVFHHKPAPIQCTWYGQPVTSGLTGIDYRIVDSITDPPGTEGDNIERLMRIDPCCFAFWPAPGTPEPREAPSQREDSPTRGTITFGSFSNLMKFNDEMFRCWACVLRAVPGSRLVLRHTAMASPGVKKMMIGRMAAAGLGDEAESRVIAADPAANAAAMMPMYHEIDIALDTFPYCGMTTTCEALTMGVPVVTLPVDRSTARYSESILRFMGLPELVARDADDYARIAASLAADASRLAALRSDLRPRLERTVGDARGFAARFEAAMRGAWREWCAAQRQAAEKS
ncbi:MAG: hypothetical protein KF869_12565 [Phycisphaeraceae bacterium]|nr:hypothetical protein [Phycisphaeraceae bacterium]